MRVLLLSRYGPMGASSRMRALQFIPYMEKAGWVVEIAPFTSDESLSARYGRGSYSVIDALGAYGRRIRKMICAGDADVIWIQKEALPWLPAPIEEMLLSDVPYILDLDDAVFHTYDLDRRWLVRSLLGRKIDRLMKGARLVVVGNRYLADSAVAAGARRVEIVPTVVDLSRYAAARMESSEHTRIVWIGTPATAHYLRMLAKPLAELAGMVRFTLRVIGGGPIVLPGVDVELIDWSLDTEISSIAECQVGVMPLVDSPWERGKCAYKLIQYMACGLPTVASPVGANCEVVVEGVTGYFADGGDDWTARLSALLDNEHLRGAFGSAGKHRVEVQYSLERTAPRMLDLFSQALT